MTHAHKPDPAPSLDPTITNSVEDRVNELYGNLEKLLEALNLEWCDECNAYVPSDSSDTQDPNPSLLDPMNENGPNYVPFTP